MAKMWVFVARGLSQVGVDHLFFCFVRVAPGAECAQRAPSRRVVVGVPVSARDLRWGGLAGRVRGIRPRSGWCGVGAGPADCFWSPAPRSAKVGGCCACPLPDTTFSACGSSCRTSGLRGWQAASGRPVGISPHLMNWYSASITRRPSGSGSHRCPRRKRLTSDQ